MLGNKRKYPKYRVSHSGGGMGGCSPHPTIFFETPAPHQNQCFLHGALHPT